MSPRPSSEVTGHSFDYKLRIRGKLVREKNRFSIELSGDLIQRLKVRTTETIQGVIT